MTTRTDIRVYKDPMTWKWSYKIITPSGMFASSEGRGYETEALAKAAAVVDAAGKVA